MTTTPARVSCETDFVIRELKTQSASTKWLKLLTVFLLALALRAVFLERAAVEHFDEGVYSSNIFFDESEGFQYPLRHLYAPPLVPSVVEWSTTFLGHTSNGTMLPGVLFGALTVALVFHVAGRWFGTEAAWPTAIIAALSEFHIIYSRAALTDVYLGFFLLLAVYLGTEAVRDRRFGHAVLGGIACGLAWWCKYSGWLPVAIVGTATILWILLHQKHARPVTAIVCVVLMAVVAIGVWCPVYFGLEPTGGYSAVQENHQRYVVGFAGWFDSAWQLFDSHRVLDGWLAWISLGLAGLLNVAWQLRSKHFTWNSTDEFELTAPLILKVVLGSALLVLLAASGVGTTSILICLAMGGLAGRLRWPCIPLESEEATNDEAIARWTLPCLVVLVWIGSLTLMTPTYQPYPRLTLPWLIAVWLGAGAGISWWVRANLRWHGRKEKKRPVTQQNLMMIVLCALSAFVIVKNDVLPNAQIAAWKPRSSMRTLAATTIDECVNERSRTVIYTFGEPALLYHLNASGVLTRPVSSIPKSAPSAGGEPYDVLLIEGPHARRTEAFDTMSAELARLYERAGSYDILPSDLVLLNDREAAKMTGTNARETETFHVWRLKTGAND